MERADRPSAVSVDYTMSSELPDEGWIVIVSRVIVLGPNGELRQTPEVPFNTILQATPHTVSMTVSDENEQYSCRHAGYVFDIVQQSD